MRVYMYLILSLGPCFLELPLSTYTFKQVFELFWDSITVSLTLSETSLHPASVLNISWTNGVKKHVTHRPTAAAERL